MQNNSEPSELTTMPIISFIIPAYNLPIDLLRECIESIFKLPLKEEEREIILVDDGSDESPLSGLSDYAEHIIYIRQRNSGLSGARNRGLELSKGIFVQFVDGDDKLLKEGYSHCIDIIKSNSNTDIVMFAHSDKESIETSIIDDQPVSGTSFMRHHNLRACAWGYLFRRSLLGNLRFTDGILHEDEEFTPLLLLRAEHLIRTQAKAYYYRQRPHSITQTNNKDQVAKRLNDKEQIIMRLHDTACHLSTNERTALQRRVNQLTMDYIYDIIVGTHSEKQLNDRLAPLQQLGLFPLQQAEYTRKYKWFNRVSRHAIGRKIMLALLK